MITEDLLEFAIDVEKAAKTYGFTLRTNPNDITDNALYVECVYDNCDTYLVPLDFLLKEVGELDRNITDHSIKL